MGLTLPEGGAGTEVSTLSPNWVTTRLDVISNWGRASSGKKLTMRSSAPLALLACRVDSTRWPVSEKVSTYFITSRSRTSPTRITSGASRMALRRACS